MSANLEDSTVATGLAKVSYHSNPKEEQCQRMFRLPHLLRNLYACQEASVGTGHGTTDWFQIGKGVRQGCVLSPCLFNLFNIMRSFGLAEAQAGIQIARRNINNLRYADDITLTAERETKKPLDESERGQ